MPWVGKETSIFQVASNGGRNATSSVDCIVPRPPGVHGTDVPFITRGAGDIQYEEAAAFKYHSKPAPTMGHACTSRTDIAHALGLLAHRRRLHPVVHAGDAILPAIAAEFVISDLHPELAGKE